MIEWIRRRIKDLTQKRLPAWQADMSSQLLERQRQVDAEFEPPDLPANQKVVVLLRQYRKVYGTSSPMSFDRLQEQMVPKNLTDREVRLWYWGGLQEAARATLMIINASYSKAELRRRLAGAALERGMESFPPETQRQITDGVIKFLPDGEPVDQQVIGACTP